MTVQNFKVVKIADIDYLELIVRHLRQSPKNASAYADILTDVVSRLREKIVNDVNED